MKKIFMLGLCAMTLAVPAVAHAVHHLIFVSAIVRVSSTDCAVELTISGDNQNGFTTDDAIKIDGNTLVDLTAVVDAGIDGSSGNHDTGDKILAGSNSFDSSHGINADMVFEDSECANIDSGAVVGFFVNGSTLIDSIDTASVSGFGDNMAISKASAGATPTLVNLASASLVVGNNAGETATLGTSGGGTASSSSGGCSLIRRQAVFSPGWAAKPSTDMSGQLSGFEILTKGATGWEVRGIVHYDLRFSERSLDLSRYLPDADGEYKVRVGHDPAGMANLDSLTLTVDGKLLSPVRAVDKVTGADLKGKLSHHDSDVINAQGREIELRFASASRGDGNSELMIVGREEDPDHIPGGPCAYPAPARPAPDGSSIYHYSLGSRPGALHLDGQLAKDDQLGEPLLKSWTEPISGHPDGFTYGYVKDDGHYLYTAIDFTSDNTYDGLQDFSAVLIQTPQGWRRYQVSVGQQKWGRPGFIYTDKVAYQHKVYEFKIPLAELGVKKGAQLAMRFEEYGTASCNGPFTMAPGPTNPSNSSMFLGDDNLSVLMMNWTVSFVGGAQLTTDPVIISGEGTGNEATDVQVVRLYRDTNTNLQYDSGTDTLVGTGIFNADDGQTTIDINPDNGLRAPTATNVYVVYELKSSVANGATFRAKITNNADLTAAACSDVFNPPIAYAGASVQGGLLTLQYGLASSAAGAQNPAAGNVAPGATNASMLQFSIAADGTENQGLTTVRVTGSGTGDDAAQVTGVHLWVDADDSGTVTPGVDVELGTAQTFDTDNGTATFALSPVASLGAGVTKNYLVTYDFAAATASLPSWFDQLRGRFMARLHLRPQFFFPWAYPLALTGCGGSGTGGGTAVTLSGAPAGTSFTDADGNPITTTAEGSVVQLRTTDGALILEFIAGSENISLSGSTAGRDTDETLLDLSGTAATLIVDGTKSAVSGLPETITVFVPCDANDNEVRICPGATELTTELTACDSAIFLGSPASGFTFANTDRTGTDDCQITGAPSTFGNFLGQGVTLTTFQASLAAASDVVLTGVSSGRTINPTGLPLSGGEKTIVAP